MKFKGKTMDEIKVRFKLTENVYMTNAGLMKKCDTCKDLLALQCFPYDKMRTYKRKDTCTTCAKK